MFNSLKSLIHRKTTHAFAGMKVFAREDNSFQGVAGLSILLLALGIIFRIPLAEWVVILVACASLWICEIFNTAIEETVDLVTLEFDKRAKNAKDLGAAACLIATIVVVFVGIVIFAPQIADLI
jgi:diacylglycerol kinase